MSKEDFEKWLVGGAAFGVCAGIIYGLVRAIVALVAPVGAALLATVEWLLSLLISALLGIGAVLVVLVALRFATTSVVDSIRTSLAKMSNDAADGAVDAALLGCLAVVVGLVAYLSTGDWLKGNELGLIKGLALFTIVIAACKFCLSTGVRPFRHAVIPLLVLAYLGSAGFCLYYWEVRCSNETRETAFECLMEVHDDLPEHSGEGMAKLTAMVEGIARTLKVANQRPAASASTGSASKSAAAAEPSAGGDSGEDRRLTAQEAKEGSGDIVKRHVFLVTGHAFVFAAALFAMAYPFRLTGWRRMLGFAE